LLKVIYSRKVHFWKHFSHYELEALDISWIGLAGVGFYIKGRVSLFTPAQEQVTSK